VVNCSEEGRVEWILLSKARCEIDSGRRFNLWNQPVTDYHMKPEADKNVFVSAIWKRCHPLMLVAGVFAGLAAPGARGALVYTNWITTADYDASYAINMMVQGKDGNLYGTVPSGGTLNAGAVFQMTTQGALTNIVSFDGSNAGLPNWLVQARDGSFYGTAASGGANNGSGTIFKIGTDGTFSTLFTFQGTNGGNPYGLVQAADGSFYGSTYWGGLASPANSQGCGTIFKITTNGTFTTLAWFNGTNGANPEPPLVQGPDGNFYGTTDSGGPYTNLNTAKGVEVTGFGSVFKMTPDGTLTTLAFFNPTNAGGGVSGLLPGRDGRFYGATMRGGDYNSGTLFGVTPEGTLATVVSFNPAMGGNPSSLALATDGNFYGLLRNSGSATSLPYGQIFKVTPSGTASTLFSFAPYLGVFPNVLVQGGDGNFYGAASSSFGGSSQSTFRLSAPLAPVLQATMQAGGALKLGWSAVAGQRYQLQYCSDLGLDQWNNLGIATTATNGTMSAFDSTTVDSQRDYRVTVLP
jgi:uncharacterized repeat protein (TIGR03803 family)